MDERFLVYIKCRHAINIYNTPSNEFHTAGPTKLNVHCSNDFVCSKVM